MRSITLLATITLIGCGGGAGSEFETITITNTVTNTTPGGGTTGTATGGTTSGGITEDCLTDGVCFLTGVITEDLHLTADVSWVLQGGVFIGDDETTTTLTIDPGTVVYGDTATDGMLVVRRNSKIIADGTAAQPIVFTSSKSPGDRARGDWGGLIINGNAPINSCDEQPCEAFGEGGTGFYGGGDAADDSGVLRYVRVEFAGTLISPDNELNGIAFQGVGSGTTVDYIQVHMNADDGVEFFGGTANAKHVLVTGAGDDSLDWTDGWQGMAQHIVLQQYDDAGDQGIEADNNGENNDATPRSNPTISHITIIGSPNSTSSDLGMLLREGTAADISNAIVTGMNDSCLDIDHAASWAQVDNGSLTITRTLLDCATNFSSDGDETQPLSTWFLGQSGNMETDAMISDPFNLTSPDFTLQGGSPAASGGAAPNDPFFDAVGHIGGVDTTNDWTAGWTTSELN